VKWLRGLLGKEKRSELARLLADYPPYFAPHCEDNLAFTNQQADENLDYFLTHKGNPGLPMGRIIG
jgi:hypothetical protein